MLTRRSIKIIDSFETFNAEKKRFFICGRKIDEQYKTLSDILFCLENYGSKGQNSRLANK
jgi:hypothetical protein